jgi:hypothetical protein
VNQIFTYAKTFTAQRYLSKYFHLLFCFMKHRFEARENATLRNFIHHFINIEVQKGRREKTDENL